MSVRKNRLQDSFSALCFHDFLKEILNILMAVSAFCCIGNIIRFHKDLIINSINIGKCVMMSDQKSNAFDLIF